MTKKNQTKERTVSSVVSPLVNEHIAAEYLNCSVFTLRTDRHKSKGAPYIKMKRTVRYRLSDLDKYIKDHLISPAKEDRND